MADPTIVLNYVYCGACRCTRLVPPCPCECHVDSVRAAAPDLLAALKELTDAYAEMNAAVEEGSKMPFQPVLHRYTAAWETARAAIAKAEGRSNG